MKIYLKIIGKYTEEKYIQIAMCKNPLEKLQRERKHKNFHIKWKKSLNKAII